MAATLAMLGVLLAPAIWLSAAAIALVALVKDGRQTLVVMVMATAGTVLFASLIFASPSMVIYFLLMAWLPAWIASLVLRTVSLAASLQVMAGLSIAAILGLYAFFPEMGEIWRETLDLLVQQVLEQSQGQLSLQDLQEVEEMAIRMIPGFLVASVLFGTMISLFLARWWQSVMLNPGGFAREFQSLNLGKTAAVVATAVVITVALAGSELWYAMLLIVLALYMTQGMSILHAVFKGRQLNRAWLYLIYLVMFFSPQMAAMLILIGITDAWIDFRGRLITV
ncbi:MAG: YybS family protein [Gammaproteobacteria bacterium]|nr:YybS family protein [Gammaproteobacteria bacterium]